MSWTVTCWCPNILAWTASKSLICFSTISDHVYLPHHCRRHHHCHCPHHHQPCEKDEEMFIIWPLNGSIYPGFSLSGLKDLHLGRRLFNLQLSDKPVPFPPSTTATWTLDHSLLQDVLFFFDCWHEGANTELDLHMRLYSTPLPERQALFASRNLSLAGGCCASPFSFFSSPIFPDTDRAAKMVRGVFFFISDGWY